MKIAVFGLAANPPHIGHIAVAKAVMPYVDEVWLLPCYGHQYGKDLISPLHRLLMCAASCSVHEKLTVCDWEIEKRSKGRAFETIVGLRTDYPQHQFHWVIGSDHADTIDGWYKGRDLTKICPFIVVHRAGYPLSDGWYNDPIHRVVTADIPKISSTVVRELLKTGKADKYLLPPVLDYIKRFKLYESDSHPEGGKGS